MSYCTLFLLLAPVLPGDAASEARVPLEQDPLSPAVRAADLAQHIAILSSDEFAGRGPGEVGEAKAIEYLVQQFEQAGLEPAAPGGSWLQTVPMIELTPESTPESATARDGVGEALVHGRDVMLGSPLLSGDVRVAGSEMVFCGYGIVAPEYGWDDYAGIDARGKTVVVLVNDPGFVSKDPASFRGSAMTYYGRWTYKYEEATRQGAVACLIVHQEDAAGYGWTVVDQSWGRPQLQLASQAGDNPTKFRGWIRDEVIRERMATAELDFDALAARAAVPGAGPVPLGLTFDASLANRSQRLGSSNVVGMVKGSERPDEYVLVCAHWDHLGMREGDPNEDNIFNGAVDNASGTAALLELAAAVAAQDPPPSRSVLFLATTAEEKGLLGSAHYAADPIVPLARTVCGLNIDGLNHLGPMEDIVVVGYGASELDADLRAVATAQGRRVVPEATPERGYYFRSDHFSLAKVGVPMLYTNAGTVSAEHGEEWVTQRNDEYLRKRYHRVRDEFDAEAWDLSGAADDVRLFHALLTIWANDPRGREWSPGSEFLAARQASLAADRK